MPDTEVDTSDSILEPEVLDVESEVNDDSEENKENESFVGQYKSKEEAEKGIEEKDKTIDRLKSERDKAISNSEKTQNELLTKLTALALKEESTGKETSKEDLQAMIDKIDEKGGEAIVETMREIMVDSETAVTNKLMAKILELEERLEESKPENTEFKEEIEKLSKDIPGLSKAQYIKIAKSYKKTEKQPKRPSLPGSTGGSEISSAAEKGSKGSIDPGILAELKNEFPDLTKEEIKILAGGK